MILTSGHLVILFLYIWRMNKKWYIIGFVIILAFLGGVVSQQHISTPNQEIVLHFTSNTIDYDEVEEAIADIRQKLEAAGVSNIQVTKFDNGELNITYHSTSKVSDIRQILLNTGAISLNKEHPVRAPSSDDQVTFNFDVYEIKSPTNTDIHLQGVSNSSTTKGDHKHRLESNVIADRLSNAFDVSKRIHTNSYTFHNQNSIVFGCNAYQIPEVRAGPHLLG